MMVGQKTLKEFFRPLPMAKGIKRPFAETETNHTHLISRSTDSSPVSLSENSKAILNDKNSSILPLSPDAKRKMLSNQISTKIKLQHEKTCALHHSIGENWFKAIESEFQKPYFLKLSEFLANERSIHTIFPPEELVWSWTHHCSIQDIKVVVIGQDPYHGPGQAHGLCFSVLKGITPPPSLVNIYKELENNITGFTIPKHGNLTGWAKQGVLLLNACLTVRSGAANSHKDKGWETLTDAVIQWISSNCQGVVFLLWGSYAQKKALLVDKKKHHLLNAPHPSPLSAHRGFLGCKHFSQCNQLLIKQGKIPIDWTKLFEE